jgi:hypothetical protein
MEPYDDGFRYVKYECDDGTDHDYSFGQQSIFSPPVQTNFPLEKGVRGFLISSYHSSPSHSSSILTIVPMTPSTAFLMK